MLNFGDHLVRGVGVQIQGMAPGVFTAAIILFGVNGPLNNGVAIVAVGNSTSNGDNSAIFIGVTDTVAEINGIEIIVDQASTLIPFTEESFAISQLELATSGPTATPVPSTLVMSSILLGMFGMVWAYRRFTATTVAI